MWMLHKGLWFEEMINNRHKSAVRDMKVRRSQGFPPLYAPILCKPAAVSNNVAITALFDSIACLTPQGHRWTYFCNAVLLSCKGVGLSQKNEHAHHVRQRYFYCTKFQAHTSHITQSEQFARANHAVPRRPEERRCQTPTL